MLKSDESFPTNGIVGSNALLLIYIKTILLR